MGKDPKQIALSCFAKIKSFTLEKSDFLAGAGLILRPSEDMVNATVDEIVKADIPPRYRPIFTNSYSKKVIVCCVALDLIKPEIGDRTAFLAANKLFGSREPENLEVGEHLIWNVMRICEIDELYESLIDSAKRHLRWSSEGLFAKEIDLEELKSLKRYELRLARLKHNKPRK